MHVRGYIGIFGALLALTLVTVGVSYLDLPIVPTVALGLTIASAKAALVVMFLSSINSSLIAFG